MPHLWKTIITYLVDWNPMWLKTVEFSNKLIKWLSIPRKDLKEAIEKRWELKYSWIYFLMWEDEVYIWQATLLYKRLNEHHRDTAKDFWNNAICFTYKDGSLNESDINYLEKEIIGAAKHADRFQVINNTSWNYWLIQEHRVSDMIEFIDDLKILMNNLWYLVLSEIIDKKDRNNDSIYFIKARNSDAKWIYTEEWFVVLNWSRCTLSMVKSTIQNQYYAFRNRPKLIEQGILKQEWEFLVFTKDYTFKSPSAASMIVLGRSSNWRTAWKNKDGTTLDEMIRKNENI